MSRTQLPEGYKQTEVGIIPDDWEVVLISDLTSEVGDGIHSTPIYSSSGDYYFINGNNLENGTISLTQNTKKADLSEFKKYKKNLNDTSILLSINGTIGNLAFYRDEPIILGKSAAYLNIKREFSTHYIYYYLQTNSVRQFFEDGLTGTTIHNLGLGTIRNAPIKIPKDYTEQRTIAQALSDVDTLIASLDKLIAKQRHLKTAAMQQLLTGKMRLPGFGEGWKVKNLGELAHIQRGASPRPIDSPRWFDENSSVGWVRISDVTRSGMYLCETSQRLSPIGVQYSRPVAKNSLIMSICATVGRPIITEIDVCIHDGFVVFDNLQAEKLFIYYVLKWLEPGWSKQGQTGSQMNLNTELINGTTVRVPPPDEQRAIATVLSDMDSAIAALETRRAKTQAIKQGMMQELLTGRTRLI
jgi:type I restriction enzyme, S subunit